MKLKDCATDAGVSVMTVRRWVTGKSGNVLPAKQIGFRKEYDVTPTEWEAFCKENNIARGKVGVK